jgi:signal transduction histidine kinase
MEHSQQLEQQIVNISEEEQRRIGHDLHDGICQRLVALGFSASCLEKDLWEQGYFDWASSAKDLALGLKNAAVETRDLARGLTPVQVDTAGLAGALQELAATITQHVALDCVFDGNRDMQILDPTVANQLFRIAQEAVNNAVKHSNATRVDLKLRASGPDAVELLVADNGVGFSDENRNGGGGMGLKIMSYRARSIQAALRISPNPPAGTLVCCDAPRSLTT